MRESVFSILGPLEGRSFLDGCSGSGVLALEAHSRGASPVVCVERDRSKGPVLLRNLAIASERIQCHFVPAERFIARSTRSYSIVFLDPPFPYAHKPELVMAAATAGLVEEGGLLLIHHPAEDALPDRCGILSVVDVRAYGRSTVTFYRPVSDQPAGEGA